MEYKLYHRDTYDVHTIKTDKFRSCRMEVIFRHEFKKEDVAIDNVLTDFLTLTSKIYPKRKDLVLKLEDLYGAFFYSSRERIGEMISNHFMIEFLNPEFCDAKNYLEEVIKLPLEMLLNPNFSNAEADSETLKVTKNQLIAEVKSELEDASYYSSREAMKKTFPHNPSALAKIEDISEISLINGSDVYNYYQKFINESLCDIYVMGNLEMDEVVNIIDKNITLDTIKSDNLNYFVTTKPKTKITNFSENGNFLQTRLVVVGSIYPTISNDMLYAYQVFLTILGGLGLSSKLQLYLREKNSLCYGVSLRSNRCDGVFNIYAGIEEKNIRKAINLIKKALKEMQEGVFTEEEITNAKNMIIAGSKMNEDSEERIITSYYLHDILGTDLVFEREKKIRKVTKEEIVRVSNLFKIASCYVLKGKKVKKSGE